MSLLTARPSSSDFVLEDPYFLNIDEHPDWQGQFGNDHPVKLEIGFGMGDFLIEMAKREPQNNFVGVDFSPDCIRNLLSRVNELHLKNIRVIYGDVREKIPSLFHDGELSTVYINFPDPWPRKRHFKRRLVKPALVKLVAQKLAPEGCVHLATDSEPYAREISGYFNEESLLKNRTRELGFLQTRNHLPKTKYEKSFIYAGDKIHYLEYCKSSIQKDVSAAKQEPEFLNNDERLKKAFEDAVANAQDACDLKQVGDHLAYAGDKQWAETVYKKAEETAEDCLDLNWLAYSVSEALSDKEWAKKLYDKAETRAESSLDLNWLAYSVKEILGDTEWAKKLYQKAEKNPKNVRELCDLADSIAETFGDKDWQAKVYKKAEVMAKEHSDYYELADNICMKFGDDKWAREIYGKAEETAQDSSDLNSLVESLIEKLGDKKWAEQVVRKAEALAQDSIDFCCLADSLCEKFGDKQWARRLYKKAEENAEESFEFHWLAESLSERLGDKEWAAGIYNKEKNL
ncbi:MAG: tRNA (guanosine(46)-N7)-methyltransferase TrmB [Nitrospinae bacterium]|nr:tRNA (guanosine(46)-N7)-methyltransferase TrmB [Nitrospinota bacterium]